MPDYRAAVVLGCGLIRAVDALMQEMNWAKGGSPQRLARSLSVNSSGSPIMDSSCDDQVLSYLSRSSEKNLLSWLVGNQPSLLVYFCILSLA
jgi:hypothetical protein